MRRKFYIIALLGLATLTNSCSNFLDKSPALSFTEDDIYSSADRMKGAVLGVYTSFKNNFIAAKAYVCVENISDDIINVSGNGIEALYSYEMSVGMDTQDNYETWTAAYKTINNANTVLANLETHKEVAGDNYAQYVAEMKFCRALSYYYLNFLYGKPYKMNPNALSVPLRLQAEASLENNDLKRSTVKEVLEQILADTEDYTKLPSGGASYDGITRASQGAALMLRMRTYMEMGDYKNAILAGESIKGYQLAADIKDAFMSSATCSESIFSFPMSLSDYGGGMQSSVPYFFYSGNSIVVDAVSGIHSNLYPAYDLTEDARVSEMEQGAESKKILKKFTDGSSYQDWVPIFRYAETLLDLAECYANEGEEAKALSCLTEVRRRSLPESADILDLSALQGASLLQAIYLEKRSEFIGEAIRAEDIHRRAEDYVKRKGTSSEFTITPSTNGYDWPIPTVERANNHAITDE